MISDAKSALLPGATVTLHDPKTGFSRTVTWGGDGVYPFLQIPPATYAVTVMAAGFATIKRENIILQVSAPATLNFTLQGESAREHVRGHQRSASGEHRRRFDRERLQ